MGDILVVGQHWLEMLQTIFLRPVSKGVPCYLLDVSHLQPRIAPPGLSHRC